MKCVVTLCDDSAYVEIETKVHDSNIVTLKNYMEKKNMSSEELVDDLIEAYIKLKNL